MHIADGRSLFGAASLVITGGVLCIIAYPYYQFDHVGEPVKRGRWMWEILMNLQVLSLAFMWHCYSDRVKASEGRKVLLMRVRMTFGLVATMLPFFVIIASISLGFFERRPPAPVTVKYTFIFTLVGLMCALTPRLVMMAMQSRAGKLTDNFDLRQLAYWQLAPGIVAFILAAIVVVSKVYVAAIGLPVLFYIQSSVPFILKGLGYRSNKSFLTNGISSTSQD